MYAERYFKTKKAFKQAVIDGDQVSIFQPGGMFNQGPITDGNHCVEGPHYPEPHKWYATATIKDGFVIKVK